MGTAGVPGPASRAMWGGARRCGSCGAFVALDRPCRNPNCPRGLARTRLTDTGAAVESGFRTGLSDPLNNEVVAAMYGRYASVVSRDDREVRLRPGGGFSTNLEGRIEVDPRPLGPAAPVEDQVIVSWGGIEHELAHEAWSPRQILGAAERIAEGQTDDAYTGKSGESLSPAARRQLRHWLNVIEDGRVERLLRDAFPGAFRRIRASDLLDQRWDEAVGDAVPLHHQVIGAALYEALPNFAVRADVYRRFSPEARRLFDRIRPIVRRGVEGDAGRALEAAVEAVEVLDRAGVFQRSTGVPSTLKVTTHAGSLGADGEARPTDGPQSPTPVNVQKPRADAAGDTRRGGTRRCSSCGSFMPAGGACPQCGGGPGGGGTRWRGDEAKRGGVGHGEAGAGGKRGRNGGDSETRSAGGGASGGASAREEGCPAEEADGCGPEAQELLSDLRREASRAYARAVDRYVEETARREAQRVHDGRKHVSVRYVDGTLVDLDLSDPVPPSEDQMEMIRGFRNEYAGAARRFSRELEAIKMEVQADKRLRRRGRFDRRRMKAAVKGDRRVYYKRGTDIGQDIAVAVQVDRSSSMRCHDVWDEQNEEWHRTRPVEEAAKAAVVTAMALEQSGIPFEIRSFHGPGRTGDQCVHKTFADARASDDRLAQLLSAEGRTPMKPAVELTRTSLSVRSEQVKLAFILADGQPTPAITAEAVREAFSAMEAHGITPVLVLAFPGEVDADMRKQMDKVAGPGRWQHVRSPAALYRIVSDRIRDVYRNARRSQG
ncbi:MAG: hypothetical protein PVJ55_05250 [Anaerolineae bacterium]